MCIIFHIMLNHQTTIWSIAYYCFSNNLCVQLFMCRARVKLAEEQRQDSSWMENDCIPRVGQRKDVAAWCSGCLSCASRKPPPAKLRAPLQFDPAVRPLQCVAMDIMGPLPETSRGNKYILVIADYFTNGRKPTQYLTWRQ